MAVFTSAQLQVGSVPIQLNGGTALPCVHVIVQNDPSSTANLLIGSQTSQVISLRPADPPLLIPITDASQLWLVSPGIAVANWLATPN